MELKQIKKNIWYILTIIGTSCGVIGGWFTCAVKGYETGDWFLFWSGVVTVVGMVAGTIGWGVKLIIEIKRYIAERNKPYMAMKMSDLWGLANENQKQKGVVERDERNPQDN